MAIETKGRPAPDAGLAALRDALNRAKRYVSPAKIVFLAARYAGIPYDGLLSDHALRNFLHGKSRTLTKSNHDVLAAWLSSPLGRALQELDPEQKDAPKTESTPVGRLTRVLASGVGTLPAGLRVAGRYFMYHGSYLWPDRYVIRYLAVEDGDPVLAVEDLVRDTIKVANTVRRAAGVMLFVEGRPQILLHADENKLGLSLVIGHDISTETGALDRAFGSFLVMNANRDVAARHFLLIREEALPPADMIAETGIFTVAELQQGGHARHVRAFVQLRKLMEIQSAADPMLNFHLAQSISAASRTAGTIVKTQP